MSENFSTGGNDAELYSLTDGIVRPDRNIPLEEASQLASQDPSGQTVAKRFRHMRRLNNRFAMCSRTPVA